MKSTKADRTRFQHSKHLEPASACGLQCQIEFFCYEKLIEPFSFNQGSSKIVMGSATYNMYDYVNIKRDKMNKPENSVVHLIIIYKRKVKNITFQNNYR